MSGPSDSGATQVSSNNRNDWNLPPWAGYVLTLTIGLAGGGGLSTAAGGHDSAAELRSLSTKLEQMSGKLDVIRAEQKASNSIGDMRGRAIQDHEDRLRKLEAR